MVRPWFLNPLPASWPKAPERGWPLDAALVVVTLGTDLRTGRHRVGLALSFGDNRQCERQLGPEDERAELA